jgi:hypothetical protein
MPVQTGTERTRNIQHKRAGGAEFVSPALQRGEEIQ